MISIVVPVRRARLEETLASIERACVGIEAEIIVVHCTADATVIPPSSAKVLTVEGQKSVPQLRGVGLRAARFSLAAIVEDHVTLPETWVRDALKAVEEHPAAAWGGPVKNGRLSYLGWAHYYTRYIAFLPPGQAGYRKSLPGNNAIYRRDDLLALATEWTDGFWEAEFNQVLARERGPFWYAPELAVTQQQVRGVFEYFTLRYRHGRCYGARCGKLLSVAFPLVTGILFWRARRALWYAPLMVPYFAAWAWGEMLGYLFGADCSDTD